jgi:hypothetical protein
MIGRFPPRRARPRHVRHIFSERGREIDVVLLPVRDVPDGLFGNCIILKRFAWSNPLQIVTDRVVLILQVRRRQLYRPSDSFTGSAFRIGTSP